MDQLVTPWEILSFKALYCMRIFSSMCGSELKPAASCVSSP